MSSLDAIQAIILGVVQGATEFLPISSSAHLVIVPYLIGLDYSDLAFDTLLHIATLVGVIGYFRVEVMDILRGFFSSLLDIPRGIFREEIENEPIKRLSWFLIIGSVPAGLMGVFFKDFFEGLFNNLLAVGSLLIVTGFILWGSEILYRRFPRKRLFDNMRVTDVLLVGFAQGFAIMPGISRSGATIATGLSLGFEREFIARYSFLLSIPAILGASLVQLKDIMGVFHFETQSFVLGFIAAAISGYLAIKYFLKFIRTKNLVLFSLYCWIVGGLTVIISLL
ncbi:MAG TPA: undecaprenyl-diphosphate phosphatase [Methanothermobacter sp.]|nr:undecaprenyl-diphosphate phosphatase [Methanothermobacter sp.]HOL68907.1 undecaprenyl-diphosphate phosphatase [Methanothermobacter sp.]HPQ04954.1 undecaprenyl-diphosphate phosphatase [Methanothermobacter sp.]HPU37124.1 undecaprenyl-diphosphate phosphatase [Methanothermobacter sp.]